MKRLILLAAIAAAPVASAQTPPLATSPTSSLTLKIDAVPNNDGFIRASLCDDPAAVIPGPCVTYVAEAPAHAGATTITFNAVVPGRYALQFWHDANANGRTEIPPEGYGFGNNAAWPPSFDSAAIDVSGDTTIKLQLQDVLSQLSNAASPTGAPSPGPPKGVAPPDGVQRIDVRDNGLYGALYLPEHNDPLPAMILIGGSEGGLQPISNMAPSFAEKGYATLALAYWGAPGLPPKLENLPLEYFDTAINWLQANPSIDGAHIGMMGWSRGSEAALLTASRNPAIRAVGVIAPSSIVWQGLDFDDMANTTSAWTANGKDLPYVIPEPTAWRPNAPMVPMFTAALPEADKRPETAIPVEKIKAPVLLISGGADNLWPSTAFSNRIKSRLQTHHFAYSIEHLDYPDAGHVVFVGAPDSTMSSFGESSLAMMGGTAKANRAAWEDNWPKTLAFFDDALKGSHP